MKIVKPSIEILSPIDRVSVCKQIERIARTCYKSEDKITDESASAMLRSLVARKHFAMIEHASVSVKFICDRGVSHEIVRHRLASYAQESTRYCNYSKEKFNSEISCIDLSTGFKYDLTKEKDQKKWEVWNRAMEAAEGFYLELIRLGASPQEARSVLPTSTKTEIVVTMNLRNWYHFFNLRAVGTTGAPHPQMKELALSVLEAFAMALPELYQEQYEQALFE